MGGHVFKTPAGESLTSRLPKAEYDKVIAKLLPIFSSYKCEVIPCIPGKVDYGDVDVLILADCKEVRSIAEKLPLALYNGRRMLSKNGNVVSYALNVEALLNDASIDWSSNGTTITRGESRKNRTDLDDIAEWQKLVGEGVILSDDVNVHFFATHKAFQIDMICVPNDTLYITNRLYFSYNDFSAIVGRICHKRGLSLATEGLRVDIKLHLMDSTASKHTLLGTIVLSQDPREIFEYLGMNYDDYVALEEHFHRIDEDIRCDATKQVTVEHAIHKMFDIIVNSRLYTQDTFIFHNRHAFGTHLDRPVYQAFLKYIGVEKPLREDMDKLSFDDEQMEALKHFNKWDEALKMYAEYTLKKERKAKYNRKMIIDAFAKRGYDLHKNAETEKCIGPVCEHIEMLIGFLSDSFEAVIDECTADEVKTLVDEEVSKYIEKNFESPEAKERAWKHIKEKAWNEHIKNMLNDLGREKVPI